MPDSATDTPPIEPVIAPAADAALLACEAVIVEPDPTAWEMRSADSSPRFRVRKDWGPLRTLAATRARVTLQLHFEDKSTGRRIWNASYRRFCYKDYEPHRNIFSVGEMPVSVCLRYRQADDGSDSKPWWTVHHHTISFKGGKVALYSKRGSAVHRIPPFALVDLLHPITTRDAYPEAKARFQRRVLKLVRSKARANGVRLPRAETVEATLMAAMYPAVVAVAAHSKTVNKDEWKPRFCTLDRWLLRHMHCSPEELPKRMTGYGSKAVKRLLWESVKTPLRLPNAPAWSSTASQWREKWAWLALLRTWLPVDFAQAILRAEKIAGWDDEFLAEPSRVRRFLKQWTPKQVVRALTETCADTSTLRDTLSMLAQREARQEPWNGDDLPALPAANGPKQLHDFLSNERTRRWEEQHRRIEQERLTRMTPECRAQWEAEQKARNAEATEPFEHTDKLRAVDGKTVITASDGKVYTIVLPRHAEDLAAWGAAMHNCIGGYAYLVRLRGCQLLGVKTQGSERAVDWGVEIVEGMIRQFRGVCNQEPPLELRAAVERVLVEAKLVAEMSVKVVELPAEVDDGLVMRRHVLVNEPNAGALLAA